MFRRLIWALALVELLLPGLAHAESMTWRMRSNYKYRVELAFYAQSRNAVWPGNGQVYFLRDSQVHDFKLSCNRGEKICYGAWVAAKNTTYWGVGERNAHRCTDCCYVCGSEPPLRNLNP